MYSGVFIKDKKLLLKKNSWKDVKNPTGLVFAVAHSEPLEPPEPPTEK